MRSSTRARVRLAGIPFLFCILIVTIVAPSATAQGRGRGGAQRPAPTPPPTPAAASPQVSATAIRIVGLGLGANGSELRPFNESPGTAVVLAIKAPSGSGIVQIDGRASQVDTFADDKGQSLLEEARVGSFPKIAEDGSAAIIEVEVRARPSTGAASVNVQGAIAMTMAGGSRPTRVANVRLTPGQTFRVGTATMTVGEVTADEESTKITLGLTRTVLNTIREVRFFDAKNAPIEARRTGSGYFNEKAELQLDAKTKEKTLTIEFELWQNLRTIKAPFTVQAGLGVAAGPSATSSGASAAGSSATPKTTAPAVPATPAPPPAITASDGAASVEAVVKQLQTAALAGKGAQMLSVIYPTERATFGQGVTMALVFMPMSALSNEKEATALQKEIDALFAKHKLTPPFSKEPAELFKGVDLAAYVSDAMVFMKNHVKKGEKPADALPVPAGNPENVKVTGESAVATMNGKEIRFSKISNRWFIRLD